ncbi:ArsR/SmtB family transcription factor [Prescottella agglutinans]|uniref:DNA-binding transcriptional ArsR family regulator n=1 Tax=Prescottella agglutinans TaxID=1644129 RepID=A0ABT6M5H5_9NOCA|nr:metalloregulator ArsR/SmtB family transcription factor [Prescottella agglutinans]MDH6279559.1 DNA-binding transcriptional ArsR family regulator [Prescottella agglutinans]
MAGEVWSMDSLAILKVLSNPTRLQIMEWLKHPARYFDEDSYTQQDLGFHIGVCVGDIQARSGLAQSVISGYLQAMRDVGLLESERIGKWTYYRRNEAVIGEFRDFVRDDL